MRKFASLIAIAFLAVFAASTVVQVVGANAMALDMAMAGGDAMSMSDCQDCPGGGDGEPDGAACKLACTAITVAALTGAGTSEHAAPLLRRDRPIGMALPHGLRAAPDPFPPRTLG